MSPYRRRLPADDGYVAIDTTVQAGKVLRDFETSERARSAQVFNPQLTRLLAQVVG